MDRKAWIVIVLCCLGLAVNLYFSGKNRETLLEQERERKEAEQAQAAEEKEKGPEGDPQSEETEEPLVTPLEPEPLVEEETPILRSGDVVYTFTTFGGGIKHAEISGQYAVQDKENLVSLNKDEPQPVGRLTSGLGGVGPVRQGGRLWYYGPYYPNGLGVAKPTNICGVSHEHFLKKVKPTPVALIEYSS